MRYRNYDTKEGEEPMKKTLYLFFVFCLLFIVPCSLLIVPYLFSPVYASYVLPYPSYMPGNKLYTISRIVDTLSNRWYSGSIAQIKYHLKLADKYLVESKTLFEYKQYLLAVDALKRSDSEFLAIPDHISKASQEGKDVRNVSETVQSAAIKHTEVLTNIYASVPKSFLWVPEISASTELDLEPTILHALRIRKSPDPEFSEQ